MKRKVLIVLASALAIAFSAPLSAQVDSLSLAKLNAMLDEYYEAMIFEDVSVKERECDFLIESCKDSTVRVEVAHSILKHYMEPPLMGEEAVAIYIYEKWFANGEVKISDSWDAFQAELFYRTNRLCQLDMPSPVLRATDDKGLALDMPGSGPAVIYFYDIHCSKCRLLTSLLADQLSKVKFPLTLYAFYAGDDYDGWLAYREKFKMDNPSVKVKHVWDQDMSSDYVTNYGVTSTPKLYFIDENKIIRGRRLEGDSLGQILSIYESYYYEQLSNDEKKN